jgi:hypothetical protein
MRRYNEEEQMELICMDIFNIRYIKDPSEDIKLYVVNVVGYFIRYFENPSIDIQMAAVSNDGESIQYIHNPSLDIQMAALKCSSESLEFIHTRTFELVLLALENKDADRIIIRNLIDWEILTDEEIVYLKLTYNIYPE